MADEIFFSARYGNVDLLISELTTMEGRDIVVQSPARGDEHKLSDRGRKHVRSTATVLFIKQPNLGPYTERFDLFRTVVLFGEPQIFNHTVLGQFRARISDFEHRANADEKTIVVSCTILSETEPQLVFPTGAGVSSASGLEAVSNAADTADGKLAELGLADPTPAACTAAVTSWSGTPIDDLDASQVYGQVATLTGQISTAIDTLELRTDVGNWQAYRSMISLSYQLRRAGEAFTREATRLVDITITSPQPLRAICAALYGPALAEDRARQVAKLNRIRRPGLVPPGSYKMPAQGASA